MTDETKEAINEYAKVKYGFANAAQMHFARAIIDLDERLRAMEVVKNVGSLDESLGYDEEQKRRGLGQKSHTQRIMERTPPEKFT